MIRYITVVQTYDLRRTVLRKGISKPVVSFDMDSDSDTFHMGFEQEGEIVAVATLGRVMLPKKVHTEYSNENHNSYQLRGMAVSPEYQGKGIGNQLLVAIESALLGRNASILWCNARQSALSFYAKNNFITSSEAFEIPEIGTHFVLVKVLS